MTLCRAWLRLRKIDNPLDAEAALIDANEDPSVHGIIVYYPGKDGATKHESNYIYICFTYTSRNLDFGIPFIPSVWP